MPRYSYSNPARRQAAAAAAAAAATPVTIDRKLARPSTAKLLKVDKPSTAKLLAGIPRPAEPSGG